MKKITSLFKVTLYLLEFIGIAAFIAFAIIKFI